MKIAIYEKDVYNSYRLADLVTQYFQSIGIAIAILIFTNVEELLATIEFGNIPLVFFEVHRSDPNKDGLNQKIKDFQEKSTFIYSVTYADYLWNVCESGARLIKPFVYSQLVSVLENCPNKDWRKTECIEFMYNKVKQRIAVQNICYVEVFKNSCILHTLTGEHRYYGSLEEISSWLKQPFFYRCHRSFLVNLHQVETLQKGFYKMTNGTFVPIRRNDLLTAKQRLADVRA